MAAKATSIRIDEKKLRRLDRLAQAMDRPRSWVVGQAIDSYLDHDDWFTQEVKRGIAEADRGKLIPHGDVLRELKSLRRKAGR